MLNTSFEEAGLEYLKYTFKGHSNILEEFGLWRMDIKSFQQ